MTHNLTGRRFGRLLVIRKSLAPRRSGKLLWTCRCDCQTETDVYSDALLSAKTRSCGCLWRDSITASNAAKKTVHGETRAPRYRIWVNLKQRCYNPKSRLYRLYGARGITVCDRWLADYRAFADDMGERPSPAHSIDRIDVNGNYEPSNCRWATDKEQSRNRRDTRFVECDGIVADMASTAERLGLTYSTVSKRARRGVGMRLVSAP